MLTSWNWNCTTVYPQNMFWRDYTARKSGKPWVVLNSIGGTSWAKQDKQWLYQHFKWAIQSSPGNDLDWKMQNHGNSFICIIYGLICKQSIYDTVKQCHEFILQTITAVTIMTDLCFKWKTFQPIPSHLHSMPCIVTRFLALWKTHS